MPFRLCWPAPQNEQRLLRNVSDISEMDVEIAAMLHGAMELEPDGREMKLPTSSRR
jgi:hypothetical protein